MIAFESILLMLAAAVALMALAKRIGIPYPTLLALAGAGLALTPLEMPFHIEPALILALFVAPVLLDAAYDTSVRDLRRNWAAVSGLVLVAVALTTAAAAVVAKWLAPELPWAAAVALGAIVAPPDAAAATAVLRQLRLPHRLTVVLEGESLLNDASALLIYRLAVAAAVSGEPLSAGAVAPVFLVSVVGSVIAGPLVALLTSQVIRRLGDAPSSIIMQFVTTFGVWVMAERLGLSPILTVVTYAMTVAQSDAAPLPARLRIPSYAVWETAVVVLNVFAFMLIGLELGPVIAEASSVELAEWAVIGAAVLLTVIAARLVWVTFHGSLMRLSHARRTARGETPRLDPPDRTGGLVVAWCGMRGIVTVATALALPESFPERGLLLFVAFTVTLGTLLIQGLTLKPLVRWLDLHDDGPVEREVRKARVAMADAALAALDGRGGREADWLREEFGTERRFASEAADGDGCPRLAAKQLRAGTLHAQRERLHALRRENTIGDDAFHRLEEELDFTDLAVATRL